MESKLTKIIALKNEPAIRPHTAEKIVQSLPEDEAHKNIQSNKEFRDKTTEYIERIKRRKEK